MSFESADLFTNYPFHTSHPFYFNVLPFSRLQIHQANPKYLSNGKSKHSFNWNNKTEGTSSNHNGVIVLVILSVMTCKYSVKFVSLPAIKRGISIFRSCNCASFRSNFLSLSYNSSLHGNQTIETQGRMLCSKIIKK